ncbi:MAG: glycoside hydrolase family 3 C-terminal domain-containing protein [Bacteroidia bacterium]|nr:glycoside hydrolase family 3 C-terminal domain-containing protein [Bacteroidia bacterium]
MTFKILRKTWVLLILIGLTGCQSDNKPTLHSLVKEKSKIILEQNGQEFRDLNHNGQLDPYEDATQTTETRINDLISQMTIEEKAGLMFITGVPVSVDSDPNKKIGVEPFQQRLPTVAEHIKTRNLNHFNIWAVAGKPDLLAKWYNNTQLLAENTRLGIPITLSSDPRHHFSKNIFSMAATGFTQFCETLGLAALGDEQVVKEFAEVVRKEYLAVGIRESLHPQIDLATEPRWPRINGAFGEDAELTARMVRAYIAGMQGTSLSDSSIACMTKHFPGGGPQKEGLDPHFIFQKGQIYPGNNFDYHLIPFEAAFDANTAAIMPYYGIPTGQTDEEVAMSFNKTIITSLLREKYKFDGVVCTDWGLISDANLGPDVVWKARAWGVENLSRAERVLKVVEAGCDQFGGESAPDLIVQLVKEGKLSEERIDISLRRILRQKFLLGLFDNPFVDETLVDQRIANEEAVKLGNKTQMESMTLLKNEAVLPLPKNKLKVFIKNIDSATVAKYATVVSKAEEADFAIVRLNTPWYPVDSKNFLALSFHHGDLDFKGKEKADILKTLNSVPSIVDIYLDRPAVIPDITASSKALIANYGVSDKNLCEVLFGNVFPKGKLPFELPSSMEAVKKQKTDVPYDSENPLFKFGHGLSY